MPVHNRCAKVGRLPETNMTNMMCSATPWAVSTKPRLLRPKAQLLRRP